MTEMVARPGLVEHDSSGTEIFLYHGTNCYRRWEINRAGNLLPGRNGYSFFCNSEEAALNYARNACLRDIRTGAYNSLTCEPVVLKVRFNARLWLQVDFVQEQRPAAASRPAQLTIALLGPIPFAYIEAVLHCSHGRRNSHDSEPVRSFADGKLMAGIRRLREKTGKWRLDAWLLKHLQAGRERLGTILRKHPSTEVTPENELVRLAQVEPRLRMRSGRMRAE